MVLAQAQLGAEAIGRPGGKPGVQKARDQGQHGAQSHQPPLTVEKTNVMIGNPDVYDIGHQQGNDHFKDTFRQQQNNGRRKFSAVRFEVRKDRFQITHGVASLRKSAGI